jgi:hypothetical protein
MLHQLPAFPVEEIRTYRAVVAARSTLVSCAVPAPLAWAVQFVPSVDVSSCQLRA